MSKFIFAVPLRARSTAKNWDKTTQLIQYTFNSILAQTDGEFGVILACHEVPDIKGIVDSRVTILQADFPPPGADPIQRMVDKWRKLRMAATELRKLDGGYFMMVDADDLVSRRIVEFVRGDKHPNGYVLKRGYELNGATGQVRYQPWFDHLCGTCSIFRFDPADLPETNEGEEEKYFFYLHARGHNRLEQRARASNRPLEHLPFCGAVYVVNNGENLSDQALGWRRRLLSHILPWRSPSDAIRAEFSLPTYL